MDFNGFPESQVLKGIQTGFERFRGDRGLN